MDASIDASVILVLMSVLIQRVNVEALCELCHGKFVLALVVQACRLLEDALLEHLWVRA